MSGVEILRGKKKSKCLVAEEKKSKCLVAEEKKKQVQNPCPTRRHPPTMINGPSLKLKNHGRLFQRGMDYPKINSNSGRGGLKS